MAAAKYLRQEKSKVRREAQILRSLIQSAFVVRLAGLYESNLNSVLVTEYLAGGDLVTRSVLCNNNNNIIMIYPQSHDNVLQLFHSVFITVVK